AIGVFADSTMPRGSNTSAELASVTFMSMASSLSFSERARAVGTPVVRGACGRIDRLEDRRAHVTPARNEGREAAGLSAHDEEMDIVDRRHDRDAAVGIPLQPLRQVAVVHLAVTVIARDRTKGVARVHPEIMADVRAGPAGLRDGPGVLETQHHRAM